MALKVLQFVTEALGDASYLVVANGTAAAIDPQRDVRALLAAAREHNASIDYVLETHVHNDYLSGARELAALGARIAAPAKADLEFPHLALEDGAELQFGGVTLRAVAAPGHTYEHTAYVGVDERGHTRAAFTGGALLMGSAGRSDLLGPEHTADLTRLQWETAQRMRGLLPSAAALFPTHGAGSFCSTTGSTLERYGPLSTELTRNPALSSLTPEAFAAIQLAAPAPIPGYYRYMAPINRNGPKVYGEPPRPRLLSPEEVATTTAAVVDVRPRASFAGSHIPGSIEIEESTSLLAYTGWLIPFNAPVVLVSEDRAQADRVTRDFFRIGYEDVRGYLPFRDWQLSRRPTAWLPHVDSARAREILRTAEMPVLDTRFSSEQLERPLPGALSLPLDQLTEWVDTAPARSLVVCASGQRATMAASVLLKSGRDAIALVQGGAEELLRN
ncbi:MAG: MBL fold metallo-hydrolase [Dehalococcoidia bacterium]|nr:MBL fold metallo-hydrolase [Dehalococcoidia bacterium]